jgi:predicted Zn-dependent protease
MCNHHHAIEASAGGRAPQLHRRDIVRGLWSGALVLGVAGAGGCESAGEFFAPTDDQLILMASEAWEQTKKETPISKDARANRRLQAIGPRIATVANRPNDAWEFVVFDSPEKNAFVLPGGKVGFYKGLLDFSDNDDQVAAVLGHEVGHVTARHAAQRMGQQQATSLGLAIGGAILGSSTNLPEDQKNAIMAIAGAGAVVGILLPFSRSNELDADRLGVDYMHLAGYDVRQSVRLWEKMGQNAQPGPGEWLSTHPSPQTRIAELKAYINAKGYATL